MRVMEKIRDLILGLDQEDTAFLGQQHHAVHRMERLTLVTMITGIGLILLTGFLTIWKLKRDLTERLLLEQRLYKRAMAITQQCQQVTEDFVLASPDSVLLLARALVDLQQYRTAYHLVRNAEQRYGQGIDAGRCQLLAIELLWQHLDAKPAKLPCGYCFQLLECSFV